MMEGLSGGRSLMVNIQREGSVSSECTESVVGRLERPCTASYLSGGGMRRVGSESFRGIGGRLVRVWGKVYGSGVTKEGLCEP